MLTIREALLQGAALLDSGGTGAPRLAAEVLLAHALGRDRTYLYAHPEEPLSRNAWIHYGRYLYQRLQAKPTQYITGWQEFYARPFRVTPAVLIPRPETEHLVEAALQRISADDAVLDIGTGSGAIAITLALESRARVFGSDISIEALQVAAANGQRLQADVRWIASDLNAAFAPHSFDLVVSNPPYVPLEDEPGLQREVREWEPRIALFGGNDGLEIYTRLIDSSRRVLRPGGWLLVELGYNSLQPVQAALGPDWSSLEAVQDLAGFPRVLAARWMP